MLLIFGSLKHPSTSFLFEFLWSTWCKYFQSFYESLSSHCPSSLPQCFLPQSKVFPRCLSCAAAFHMSEEETWSYVSPFIPWLRHHRSGLLMSFVTEVMQMSSHVVLKASLSLSLSVCGHWNAERNNMKGKWNLQAVVSYSLQFPCFWYSQHWGFGVHQQRMSAGQFKMHRTDHPDCEWLEGRAIWVQPQARLDGSLWQDFL